VARWRRADVRLNAALAVQPERRDAAAVAAIRAELAEADAAIAAVDARFATEFPDFAELQRPAAADFDAVQARLGEDEILLFFADTGAFGGADWETYLWAVPKSGAPRWVKLPRSTGELVAAVREMRDLMGVGGAVRGASSLATRPDAAADRPSRVLRAANAIYGATLAPVADMIAGKELVIVPSKRLASLPFHLLVGEPPEPGSDDRYRDARWLAKSHAITVLPSVSALGALPERAAPRPDATPYLGFANPLLTGPGGGQRGAFGRDCGNHEPPHMLVAETALPELSSLFRGAVADVEAVRQLQPLPETVDEACAIAGALGAGVDAVRLGADASETEVKRLSAGGAMERARILHFATHGLVSGELEGLAEPAIVLTPPETASEEDDALLTASEVSMLRLDADWVILSACNTAAGDGAQGGGGEALSGLARAFFYAGARSLMVSHWPVASDAAVRLATGAVAELAAQPDLSRAEALRRAMVAEIEAGGRRADPANWAPFIVVGG
jgi:CHAT domain-containing protein